MEIIKPNKYYSDCMKPGSFVGAALTASGINNALIIFHGISGCNIEAVHFRSDQIAGGGYIPIIPTGLNESDCVYGGIEKLFSTLRVSINQAKKRNKIPEIVFILTSDATSIVGDDIKTAAKTVENETGIKIIALDTPGFAGGLSHGTDSALYELIKLNSYNNRNKDLNSINLIAPYLIGSKNWNNDFDEIVRLLDESEINVNLSMCRNFDMQTASKFADAKYNYILSSEELPKFEKACLDLNIKTLTENFPLPVGVANTEEWLLKLAEMLGNKEKARQVLIKDKNFINNQLKFNYNFSWMSTLMYGKKCGLLAHAKFGASLARCLLWDFGIIPKVIGLICESDRAAKESIELLESIKNQSEFTVLINPSYGEYMEKLKETKVDFAIGSAQDKPLCNEPGNKIPHLSLTGFNFFNQYNFIPWSNFGIKGTLGLLSELSQVMEKTFS